MAIGIKGTDLNTEKILDKAIMEYVTSHEFAEFMGMGESSVIQMKDKLGKGAGDAVVFALREFVGTGGVLRGEATTLEGNEEEETFRNDKVVIDYRRAAIKLDNHELQSIRTPIDLYGALKSQLILKMTKDLQLQIVEEMTLSATPKRNRVLFGNDDINYNATLATAIATVESTDTLSVDTIYTLKDKAKNVARVSNNVTGRKIRPVQIQTDSGVLIEKFVMWTNSKGARDLAASTEWKDLRAADMNNELASKYFSGSEYLGEVDGVMVFRIDSMDGLTRAGEGAASADVYCSVLVGAQAFGYAYGNKGEFADSPNTDYGKNMKIGYTIIDNIKKLVFSDGTVDEENGIVFAFHG